MTACPECGTALPAPRAGRRAVYCGKACRQAAYRARTAAPQAASQGRRLRRQLTAAVEELMSAVSTLGKAHARMTQAEIDASGDQDILLVTGCRWENGLHDAARKVQHAAGRIAYLAQSHNGAATRYRTAGTELGIPPASRKALLNAISDLARLTAPEQIRQLPADPAAALKDPAAALAAALARDHPARPSRELLAAAAAILAAGRPHSRQLPASISTALTRLARLLPS